MLLGVVGLTTWALVAGLMVGGHGTARGPLAFFALATAVGTSLIALIDRI